ncbi:MAG TPA: hypothetical protein EYP14_00220, partial [Planctomycetaceae bacterium]|nr:hypothetical protein [Planctomycetaceae bacterium]
MSVSAAIHGQGNGGQGLRRDYGATSVKIPGEWTCQTRWFRALFVVGLSWAAAGCATLLEQPIVSMKPKPRVPTKATAIWSN